MPKISQYRPGLKKAHILDAYLPHNENYYYHTLNVDQYTFGVSLLFAVKANSVEGPSNRPPVL